MNETKVLLQDLINELDANFEPVATLHWHGHDIGVKKILTIDEARLFTSVLSSIAFIDGEYSPELYEFSEKAMTLAMFTNIDMGADLASQYKLIYGSDLFEQVMKIINSSLQSESHYADLTSQCRNLVKYRAKSDIKKLEEAITTFKTQFEDMAKVTEEAFKDVSQEDIKAVFDTVSEGSIDERKLMQAFIDINSSKKAPKKKK